MMNFRQLREAKGYSQEQLACMLGLNRATIANYEQGKAEPKLRICYQLAQILQVSLEQLALALGYIDEAEEISELVFAETEGVDLPKTDTASTIERLPRKRRKGQGTGFVEKRIVTVKGREYLQYWFHWQEYHHGRIFANSKYIPKHQVETIISQNDAKVPVQEILAGL